MPGKGAKAPCISAGAAVWGFAGGAASLVRADGQRQRKFARLTDCDPEASEAFGSDIFEVGETTLQYCLKGDGKES